MCIAIVKTKQGSISDEILRNCVKNNKDGCGIAYSMNNKIYIIKGLFDADVLIKKVRDVERIANGNILIHCRISTSGLIDVNNAHPHKVNEDLVLIHNGILDIDVPKDSKKSDTVSFIEKYLKELPSGFEYNKSIMRLIEDRIGKSNKFCFLNSKGDYFILNESSGEWINGVWYSNQSYIDYSNRFKYEDKYTGHIDDDLDDMYMEYYNMSRGELLDTYKHSTLDYKDKIKRHIWLLDDDQLDYLGDDPLYNIETEEFLPSSFSPDLNEFYLDELDIELATLYENKYYMDEYTKEEQWT